MALKALLFDVNGTLIDIETDENLPEIYRVISRYLSYFGLTISPQELKETYFRRMDAQLKASPEKYPEADVRAIWQKILQQTTFNFEVDSTTDNQQNLPLFLAR